MANRAKPSFPQLNRSHPLAQGLVFDMPFFERTGTNALETTLGTNGTFAGGASWADSIFGSALQITGANSANRVSATSRPIQDNLSKITIEMMIAVSADNCRCFDKRGASLRWEILINSSSSPQVRFLAGWSGATAIFDTPSGSIVSGKMHHIIITYDFGSTANTPSIYIDGIKQTITTTTAPIGTANTDGTNITIGNRLAADAGNNSVIPYGRFWNRILSQVEGAQLYADPFQIYAKKPAFAQFAAAGIPAPGAVSAYRTLMGVGV